MADSTNKIVELDLGIRPEAAVSGAVLFQTEGSTFLTFNAMRPTTRMTSWGQPYLEDAGTALFEFERCLLTRFGYPNDEARWGIPYFKEVSYGIYEVQNSSWIKEVVRLNRYAFPNTTDEYVAKHYLFAFHDSSFECLADGFEFKVLNEPIEAIVKAITSRIIEE